MRFILMLLLCTILLGCVQAPASDRVEQCEYNGKDIHFCSSLANGSNIRFSITPRDLLCNESVDYAASEIEVRSCPYCKETALMLAAKASMEGENGTGCPILECRITEVREEEDEVFFTVDCEEEVAKKGDFYGFEILSPASYDYTQCRSFDPSFINCTSNGEKRENCTSVIEAAMTKR